MPVGYVRVTNKRIDMAPDNQPEEGEVVIPVDRNNPALGNRHRMRQRTRDERARVIAEYKTDLDDDWAAKGPMYQAIVSIAVRVLQGERICLQCHCFPLDCHANLIAAKVSEVVRERQRHTEGQSRPA